MDDSVCTLFPHTLNIISYLPLKGRPLSALRIEDGAGSGLTYGTRYWAVASLNRLAASSQ